MKKAIFFSALLSFIATTQIITAQYKYWDIVTLTEDKGVIKGFITEIIPGQNIKIEVEHALLRIDFNEILLPFTRETFPEDTLRPEKDIILFKDSSRLSGKIIEKWAGHWFTFETDEMPPKIYSYDEIAKLQTVSNNPDADIFMETGILDLIQLKNNQLIKGIIIEQELGKLIKIKTKNEVLIFGVNEIARIEKIPYNSKKNLFKQSAILDVISLKNGSRLEGIITEQIPGEMMKITIPGNSKLIYSLDDIEKIKKIINPHRENPTPEPPPYAFIKEPEFIGDVSWIIDEETFRILDKYTFRKGTRKNSEKFLIDNTPDSIYPRINCQTPYHFLVHVENNTIPPGKQIFIFPVEFCKIDRKTYSPCINTIQYPFLNNQTNNQNLSGVIDFSHEKFGESSFLINFTIETPGEYAIYTRGNHNSVILLKVDQALPGSR